MCEFSRQCDDCVERGMNPTSGQKIGHCIGEGMAGIQRFGADICCRNQDTVFGTWFCRCELEFIQSRTALHPKASMITILGSIGRALIASQSSSAVAVVNLGRSELEKSL